MALDTRVRIGRMGRETAFHPHVRCCVVLPVPFRVRMDQRHSGFGGHGLLCHSAIFRALRPTRATLRVRLVHHGGSRRSAHPVRGAWPAQFVGVDGDRHHTRCLRPPLRAHAIGARSGYRCHHRTTHAAKALSPRMWYGNTGLLTQPPDLPPPIVAWGVGCLVEATGCLLDRRFRMVVGALQHVARGRLDRPCPSFIVPTNSLDRQGLPLLVAGIVLGTFAAGDRLCLFRMARSGAPVLRVALLVPLSGDHPPIRHTADELAAHGFAHYRNSCCKYSYPRQRTAPL